MAVHSVRSGACCVKEMCNSRMRESELRSVWARWPASKAASSGNDVQRSRRPNRTRKAHRLVTEGLGTKTVPERLKALQREADVQRKALAELERLQSTPIKLPTPEAMLQIVFDFEHRFDVVGQLARELEARRLAREPDVIPMPRKMRPMGHDTGRSRPRHHRVRALRRDRVTP